MRALKVNAIANAKLAFVFWSAPLYPGCLGISVRRIDTSNGGKTVLPAWVPFEGQTNPDWTPKTTDQWPVQKYQWRDLTGTPGKTYKYEVVPMFGTPDNPTPRMDLAGTSNAVTLSTDCGKFIQFDTTNGYLPSQSITKHLPRGTDGSVDFAQVWNDISTPGTRLRDKLSGGIMQTLFSLERRAVEQGGKVLESLYELSDPECVQWFLDHPKSWEMILANTGKDDITNAPARKLLHALGLGNIHDRMVDSNSIGHNKSAVYVDAQGVPRATRISSVNLTPTGICTQVNNCAIIESEELARACADYFQRMKAEGNGQSAEFRRINGAGIPEITLPDGTKIEVWFAPNTELTTKPKDNPPTPPDMAKVFQYMRGASQVFFAAFMPGSPSFLTELSDITWKNHNVFVRGIVNSPQALPWKAKLWHRYGSSPQVVTASALENELGGFLKEVLKLPDAHAIIHSKVIVIDPFGAHPIVVLGSHNLGFKASYQNDETMVIVKDNPAFAQAMLVHILDAYDHYRFRFAASQGKGKFTGFLKPNDSWQKRYLSAAMQDEMNMWTASLIDPAA